MTEARAIRARSLAGREVATVCTGIALVGLVAVLVPGHADIAMAIAGAALLAALLLRGSSLPIVVALPAVWLGEITRFGGGAVSVADAFLIAGAAFALLRVDLRSRALQ